MPRVITSMLSLIHHRGPDEAGYYLDDGIAMGAVRLSIIDLAGGLTADGGRAPGATGSVSTVSCTTTSSCARSYAGSAGRSVPAPTPKSCSRPGYSGARLPAPVSTGLRPCRAGRGPGELFLARDRYGKRPLFYAHRRRRVPLRLRDEGVPRVPRLRLRVDTRRAEVDLPLDPAARPLPVPGHPRGSRWARLLTVRGGAAHAEHVRPSCAVDAPPFTGTDGGRGRLRPRGAAHERRGAAAQRRRGRRLSERRPRLVHRDRGSRPTSPRHAGAHLLGRVRGPGLRRIGQPAQSSRAPRHPPLLARDIHAPTSWRTSPRRPPRRSPRLPHRAGSAISAVAPCAGQPESR